MTATTQTAIDKATDPVQVGDGGSGGIFWQAHWDDLRFPASTFNPPGAASDPDIDATNGTLLFDAAGTEVIFVQIQLPHAWKVGTDLKPHVHWCKTTSASGDVFWQLDYKWAKIGEVRDEDFTTISNSTVVSGITDDDTAGQHLLTTIGTITPGSDVTLSDMLICKLSRVGGNAADTYGADVELFEFDLHIQIDAPGSINEFTRPAT